MTTLTRTILGFLLVLAAKGAAEGGSSDFDKPNVILLLADDLGWADLGCYGNRFNETPNIDRLASQGIRFTQFYAGPVCSPTRANLQSGQDQARFGITQHIPGHRRPFARLIDPVVPRQLPREVETFAEHLKAVGYTTGYFGKWHLGGEGFGPGDQGWETVLEFVGNTVPQRVSGSEAPVRSAGFLAGKAMEFLEENRTKPFLLQVSFSAVHLPLSTTPELLAKYSAKPPVPEYPSRPEYAGLLEELDQSVGRIVEEVDRLGLAERTLVLFLSDNGGLEHEQGGRIVTSNRPLRGEKGTVYEGGIRIPAVARWSGRIPAGATCETPAITMDVSPMLVELAGSSPTAGQPLDGVSLAPLLFDPSAKLPRDTFYWHLPHYHHSTPAGAIRRGDWKLIEFFEDGRAELYDLRQDRAELNDLAGSEPERVRALSGALAEWRESVGARMPQMNPGYDPARASEMAGRTRRAER